MGDVGVGVEYVFVFDYVDELVEVFVDLGDQVVVEWDVVIYQLVEGVVVYEGDVGFVDCYDVVVLDFCFEQ